MSAIRDGFELAGSYAASFSTDTIRELLVKRQNEEETLTDQVSLSSVASAKEAQQGMQDTEKIQEETTSASIAIEGMNEIENKTKDLEQSAIENNKNEAETTLNDINKIVEETTFNNKKVVKEEIEKDEALKEALDDLSNLQEEEEKENIKAIIDKAKETLNNRKEALQEYLNNSFESLQSMNYSRLDIISLSADSSEELDEQSAKQVKEDAISSIKENPEEVTQKQIKQLDKNLLLAMIAFFQ